MATKCKYRLLDASAAWGIAVDLIADYAPLSDVAGDREQVTDRLYVQDEPIRHCPLERFFLKLGLKLVSKEIAEPNGSAPVAVRLLNIDYRPTDYQPEGVAPAIAEWASLAFGFPALDLRGKYNPSLDRYVFPFEGRRDVPPEFGGASPSELQAIAKERLKTARRLLNSHQAAEAAESASDAVWSALRRLVPRRADRGECQSIAVSDIEALRKGVPAKNISRQVERHLVRIVSLYPDVNAKPTQIRAGDAGAYLESAEAIVTWAEREAANVGK